MIIRGKSVCRNGSVACHIDGREGEVEHLAARLVHIDCLAICPRIDTYIHRRGDIVSVKFKVTLIVAQIELSEFHS